MWDSVKELENLGSRTTMGVLLLVIILAYVWFFLCASKRENNNFDMIELFMEDGKASKWATILLVAFTIHSWVLVSWVMNGAATLADLATYGTTWVAPILAKMYFTKKDDKDV